MEEINTINDLIKEALTFEENLKTEISKLQTRLVESANFRGRLEEQKSNLIVKVAHDHHEQQKAAFHAQPEHQRQERLREMETAQVAMKQLHKFNVEEEKRHREDRK